MAVSKSTLEILIQLRDDASRQMSGINRGFSTLASAAKKAAIGIAAAGAAIGSLGGLSLKSAASMEQTKIAFETMLGSAEKADEFIRDLVSFAKTTPFELKGLEDAAKQLLAYGFAQDEVLPNLKALGDVSSGVGMDKLPNLILAFGQVKAATRLTGMELRQFTEAGVPLLGELAKQFGTTAGEIQQMVSDGEIGFEDVQKALMNLTNEGGRFNNLMAKQSQSLSGMVSNLRDVWDIFLRNQGAKLIEWAKKFVQLAIEIVQNHLPKWVEQISALGDKFGFLGDALGGLPDLFNRVKLAFTEFAELVQPLTDVAAKSFALLWDVIEFKLWPALQKLWEAIKPLAPFVGATLYLAFITFVNILTVAVTIFATLIEWVAKFIEIAKTVLKPVVDFLTAAFTGLLDGIQSVIDAIKSVIDFATRAYDKVKSVFSLGGGGGKSKKVDDALISPKGEIITTNPRDYLIATQNPFALAGTGGSTVINIGNLYGTDQDAAERFSDLIVKNIQKQIKL